MKALRLSIAVLACLLDAKSAESEPTAFYNPSNGNVVISNDFNLPLPVATFISRSGFLTNASSLLAIPGTSKDDTEFPFAYSYFPLSPGVHNTGNTVVPGTIPTDLEFEYRSPLDSPTAPLYRGLIVVVPEPLGLALACTALWGVASLRRGRR